MKYCSHQSRKTFFTFGIAISLSNGISHAQTTLFADNFDRIDSTELNDSTDGKSGTLGALDWIEVSSAGNSSITTGQLKYGETGGGGGGWAVAYLDHNFTDADITASGGFSVSIDLASFASNGGTRFMGLAIGHSKAEMDGWSINQPTEFDSDFFVGIDRTGTNQLGIFSNGVATPSPLIGFSDALPQTLRVDFTNLTNFNAGSTVNYEVFTGETSQATGTFTWSGTNENYLGFYANMTLERAILDNLVISVSSVIEPLALGISQNGGNLDFQWRSLTGKQYTLVSSSDLSTAPSTWATYDDGNTIYENIPASGTGTTELTGVVKVGTPRFFALVEQDAVALPQ